MKILMVLDSPGATDFLQPAWPLLAAKHDCRLITIHEAAKAHEQYLKFNPDLLVAGISSRILGPYFVNEIVREAAMTGKPVIAAQDYWANHRASHNRVMLTCWQKILVPDNLARDYLLADNYSGEIVVTGHPGWEKCFAVEVKNERQKLRSAGGISEKEFVLLWAGSATPASEIIDETSFRFLLETIMTINPRPSLIARPHPRDEEPARYERLAQEFNFTLRQPPPSFTTDELLPLADVIVATYSTSLIHAALLNLPAVSLLLPDLGKKKMMAIGLDDFPLNQFGASLGIYENNSQFLAEILLKLRDDNNFRAELSAKQKTFAASLPRHAAQNIANAILNWEK